MKKLLMGLIALACFPMMVAGQERPIMTYSDKEVIISNCGVKPELKPSDVLEWNKVFKVFTDEAFKRKINQGVYGTYSWKDDGIAFRPAYPFAAGGTYHAVLNTKELSKYTTLLRPLPLDTLLTFSFTLPELKTSQTRIESVYPESDVLPENLLRMYVQFSSPMMPGEAYDHIKLYDEKGEIVPKAFLVIDQELWDMERKRFTLFFDPGRIKRTLKSNLELGPALSEGNRYHLVIDSTWRDVNSNYLGNSVRKSFSVGPAQRSKLCTTCLKVVSPASGPKEDLVLLFDRPMDRALTSKYISVNSSRSERIPGVVKLVDDVVWRFTPDRPWEHGNYEIIIDPLLEDVAGNNFNNAFDVDLAQEHRVNSSEKIRLSFQVKPSAD